MDVESVFVTGANRGIGLEFVRQFAHLPKPPHYIFATYRDQSSAEELKKLRDATEGTEIIMIKMDVTNLDQIQAAKKITEDKVGEKGLNLLINNAGVNQFQGFPDLTEEVLLFHFKTNTIGPIMVLQELLPLMQKSANRENVGDGKSVSRAAVLNISSKGGSISTAGINALHKLPIHGYRISKAALNMAMKTISADLNDKEILVVMMCPGWVKTDMGSQNAPLELHDSVSTILKTLPTLNDCHQGKFISRVGEIYNF